MTLKELQEQNMKEFEEKFYNENLIASSSVFHSKYTSREGYLMIDIKQFISETLQKERDRLVGIIYDYRETRHNQEAQDTINDILNLIQNR